MPGLLGEQNLDGPGIIPPHIQLAPMETIRHSLPELDSLRREAKAGPIRRTRNDHALEALLEFSDAALELLLVRDRSTLLRRPSADLTPASS